MASAQDLRKRIKSVTNTQQITKAMKMVASARLRRAQAKADATRPYAEKIGQILRHISTSDLRDYVSPLLESRPVKRTCYIVIGADKGKRCTIFNKTCVAQRGNTSHQMTLISRTC